MNSPRTSRPSDDAVKTATGKTWKQWFSVLDRKGMNKLRHREIAEWIHEKNQISGWWSQTVTVEYEKERGMRVDYQKPSGFEVSVGKTINSEPETVFHHFNDQRYRKKWLSEEIEVSKSTPGKSLRAACVKDGTRISVNFYPKGKTKCQVTVQHMKLKDSKSALKKKSYWSKKLSELKALLES